MPEQGVDLSQLRRQIDFRFTGMDVRAKPIAALLILGTGHRLKFRKMVRKVALVFETACLESHPMHAPLRGMPRLVEKASWALQDKWDKALHVTDEIVVTRIVHFDEIMQLVMQPLGRHR
mmetsp:Transcript_36667/g.71102  ORF Transcript_36667/g.71102 Transcript_36667/m.71102 type:complete len:120 (+) Transcript_36667:953-1312(+)